MSTLNQILANLRSGKATDRKRGIDGLQQHFSDEAIVSQFVAQQSSGKGLGWLIIYQALFECVVAEIVAFNSKKTSSTSKTSPRLISAINIVRWLTARTVMYLNSKTVAPLVQHLFEVIKLHKNVQEFIWLDYAKTLNCLLSHRPHLENLSQDAWVNILEISFNAVLGDAINTEFWDKDSLQDVANSSEPEVTASSDMDEDTDDRVGKKRQRSTSIMTSPKVTQPDQRPHPRRQGSRAVKAYQLEFAEILATLLSFEDAPILAENTQGDRFQKKYPALPVAILNRLQRILSEYPGDSSLTFHYLRMITGTLDHLELNVKDNVAVFARSIWSDLVGLWTGKRKELRPTLLLILRRLFQFITLSNDANDADMVPPDTTNNLMELWSAFSNEFDNRKVLGLSIDSLRLETVEEGWDPTKLGAEGAFCGSTFRAGPDLSPEEASFWVFLELQADCAAQLFQLSESVHANESDHKRARRSNAIPTVLDKLTSDISSNERLLYLQTLLFIIDRHWHILHDRLKQRIFNTLNQCLSIDDNAVQSWVFINFAAMTCAEKSLSSSAPREMTIGEIPLGSQTWDSVWAHAVRRMNVPGVCRAACHAGNVVVMTFYPSPTMSSTNCLASERVLLDIESVIKDIDVQGPSYPYDSVCAFISRCLTISSQDVRLNQLHLEDKALSWILENWSPTHTTRSKLNTHQVSDVLSLLARICGLTRQFHPRIYPTLPDCPTVDFMIEQRRVKVVNDFILHARLSGMASTAGPPVRPQVSAPVTSSGVSFGQSAAPRHRERKISAFFTKTLEKLVTQMEEDQDSHVQLSLTSARGDLDAAAAAVLFECLLSFNGISSSRVVIQLAAKTLPCVISRLSDQWNPSEKVFVLQTLELLIPHSDASADDTFPEPLCQASQHTGIRQSILLSLQSSLGDVSKDATQLDFYKQLWQHPDTPDLLNKLSEELYAILDQQLCAVTDESTGYQRDEFGPSFVRSVGHYDRSSAHILQICIRFRLRGQRIQLQGGHTRDSSLTDLMIDSIKDYQAAFHAPLYLFFQEVEHGNAELSASQLNTFVTSALFHLNKNYAFKKNTPFRQLMIKVINAGLSVWVQSTPTLQALRKKVQGLCGHIAHGIAGEEPRFVSWRLKNAAALFLERYLSFDPLETDWFSPGTDIEEVAHLLPRSLLFFLNGDPDARTRFQVATINPKLFSLPGVDDLLDVYSSMTNSFFLDDTKTEFMVTRLLALGNTMIANSALRRGAYWHFLETYFKTTTYLPYMRAILSGVSHQLGMKDASVLFRAYGAQLACTLISNRKDLAQLHSQLLGYSTIQQCLESALDLFTPINIVMNNIPVFDNSCKILGKLPDDVKEEYFGSIVGTNLAFEVSQASAPIPPAELEKHLVFLFPGFPNFKAAFSEHAASIVATVLRTLMDQNFSKEGPIAKALVEQNADHAKEFQALVRYRNNTTFNLHKVNNPSFDVSVVLRSLDWALEYAPEASSQSLSYHVLHILMAAIHETPLVNEQNRLINALCLWIASHTHHFTELSLLHTLAHNASLMLSQPDLARAAQSLLEWTFKRYITEKLPEPRIRSIITRCCAAAQTYSRSTTFSELGSDLFNWIENQALRFLQYEGRTYRGFILDALSAWPRPLTHTLGQLYEGAKVQNVCTYLGDLRVTSNKFHLSRRLRDFAASGLYSADKFSGTDFWRLKDSIPTEDEVQDDDIVAFATLLYLNHGQISGLNLGEENTNHPRHIHKHFHRLAKERPEKVGDKRGSHDAIISGLLAMLEDENPSRVFAAYHTLCLCITALNSNDFVTPKSYKPDLLHLIRNHVRPLPRPTTRLADRMNSDLLQQTVNDFPTWIRAVATALVDELSISNIFYGQLHRIVADDASFSETILPILVHTLLEVNAINGVKSEHQRLLSQYFTTVLKDPITHPSCLQAIVDVVLHARYFLLNASSNNPSHPLDCNKWLQLDFTLLAQSATRCGSYTTALLFLELDADMRSSSQKAPAKEHILYEIYAHIDEPDGFYGIQTDDLQSFLVKRFHHEEQWDKALRFHGAALEAGSSGQTGLVQSFHSFGFDHMALDSLRNADRHSAGPNESSPRYKLGWRTETWDLPDPSNNETGAPLYLALRAVHRERDTHALDNVVWTGMRSEVERLRCLGSENVAEIRAAAQDLMCLNQILQFRQGAVQEQANLTNVESSAFWRKMSDLPFEFGFADLEALMTVRLSLLRSMRYHEELGQIGNMATPATKALMNVEKACLVQLSKAARVSGKHQIALNSILRAQRLDKEPSTDVSEEFANVLWAHKEEKTAVQFLQNLIGRHEGSTETPVATKALWNAHLGSWIAEACLEKPSQIWESYFSSAIDLVHALKEESTDVSKTRAKVYRECAMFAERQYHVALKSPDGLRWKLYVERKRQEVETRSQQLASSAPAHKTSMKHELDRAKRLLDQDALLFQKHHADKNTFLQYAVEMHSRCLELSDEYDTDSVLRLSSLWFANFEDQTPLQWIMPALDRISSHKFVFLSHQLTARLSTEIDTPQEVLQHLVMRMCSEHPFHSLYQVYCLSDHTTGLSTTNRRQSGRSFSQSQVPPSDRATAANTILEKLRGENIVGQRVRDIERLCAACLQWAKYPLKNHAGFLSTSANHTIPSGVTLRSIENLKVPVSTARTPIDLTMEYNDCTWITRYDTIFRNAGGNNVPKIMTCVGSDGRKYKQLFKGEGNDDLRQDAVMEQVFDLVNSLLRRDQQTHRRSLQVRDYKVIPLDTQAGLLEFVGNTQQLGNVLKRLHTKYNPKDNKPQDFVPLMKNLAKNTPPERKLKIFNDFRERFKPAMRHYFTETHKIPLDWFRTRLAYTRSVATTSIVGHVLGLGDRHVSNILIDNVSGEVVHIDLGIAFEQGKLLPVPETVPFRMTADMVDGMGTSGTAGVFQRCAEETLRVLREESGVIMTVLEVFKHDPLYQWTASEIKVQQTQEPPPVTPDNNNFGLGINMLSNSADEAADRALSSVARKLDKSLSVESTVNELIAEATDVVNLATIYFGWSPHL